MDKENINENQLLKYLQDYQYLLEVKVFKRKVNFNNTGRFYSGSQNVLFGWLIVLRP